MLELRKSNDIYYFYEDDYFAHGVWLTDSIFELTFEGELFIMNLDNYNIENVRTSSELYYQDAETVLGKEIKTCTTYYNVDKDDWSFKDDNGDWSDFILGIRNILEELEELVEGTF